MSKTSDAQVKASRRWEKRNRKKANVDAYRRTTRSYIRNHLTLEEIPRIRKMIDDKEKELLEEVDKK